VLNVAAITTIPLTSEWNNAWVGKEGTDQVPLAERPVVSWPSVSRDYFAIMNIPLLAGRIFQDEGETERVAVVSETAARILWPGEYPIGRKIRHWMSAKSAWLRVIGVVADVRSNGLDQAPPPLIYRPFSQRGGTTFSIVVHTTLQARALQPIMRQQIWKVDDRIPVPAMRTIAEIVSQSVATRRMETTLIGVFAIVAALLAGVGIFGVVSYSVLKRTREFAVRLALGANQQHIRLLILRHGMTPVLVGMASGVLATIFAMRLIRSLLFDVATVEPFAFVAGALALAVSGLLPCYRAAQKAARTDPALALQAE
jgi:predicted permease